MSQCHVTIRKTGLRCIEQSVEGATKCKKHNGDIQCAAKSRRGPGGRCMQSRMVGSSTCKLHNGRALMGIHNPNFKTGRHSRDLPTRLAGRYEEAMRDVELLNMRHEIALLDVRISEVLEQLTSGESGELWKNLQAYLQDYDTAMVSSAPDAGMRVAAAFQRLRDCIQHGYEDWQTWAEVRTLIDDRRRVVDSERSRLKDMQQMISAEQLMTFIGAFTDIVRRNVPDPRQLEAISTDIRHLISRNASQPN